MEANQAGDLAAKSLLVTRGYESNKQLVPMAARAIGHFQWSLELHRKLIGDAYRNECINRALRKVVRKGINSFSFE